MQAFARCPQFREKVIHDCTIAFCAVCRYYTCLDQGGIQLYMVLDGHDGSRAVKFAQTYIPHFLLRSELVGGDKRVMDALRSAIVRTEREFFIGVDPYITRKVTLQYEIEVSGVACSSLLACSLGARLVHGAVRT